MRIFTLAVATAMLAPGAAAWYSYGSNEPDNHWDRDPSYMFQDGPGSAMDRIYFNVFNGISGGVSPNSATLGSRVTTGAGVQGVAGAPVGGLDSDFDGFAAFYGVWRDCNHDGYVGMADGALREYRAEASSAAGHPVDTTLCPAVPDVPASSPKYAGPVFNSNGWITEMLPIGSSSENHGAIQTDHRTVYDRYASVWGDAGDPSTHNVPLGGVGCPGVLGGQQDITHTGGLLGHADCVDGHRPDNTRDQAVGLVPALGAVPEPSSLWSAPPVDQPVPQQVSGSDSSDNSYVSGLADCSKDPLVDTSSVTTHPNSGEGKSGVRPPGSPKVNTNGDVRGTVNYTHEISPDDDCNTADDPGRDFDSGFQQVNLVAKDSGVDTTNTYKSTADFQFTFRQWNNRQGTANGGCGTGATGALCGMPADAGLPQAYTYEGTGDNMWAARGAGGSGVGPGSGFGGANADVKGTLKPSFDPAEWYTFYASTTLAGYNLPGGVGTYGSQECLSGIGRDAPTDNGWQCDPDLWWLIDGTTQHNLQYADSGGHFWGTVGDPYQFRDVDCYDGTLVAGSASPTHGDVGAHSVPVATDPTQTCA